ncbi:MFS transporter [Cohnella thailandensis]|uniref:MFS transporter n=1 Tax=Cohnella thailandensis TaxID=557557 RepID=A0A841SRJ3_9BACL|nr:MFS transporter [Cohnella thailandensis]MBB6633226.1 MFS transporter [Cohnella thailandensis]MBP1975078.1 FHS family glucose/mannose:H+ symporter-like MFS transporter [Cohnella thailandensis]
MSRLIFLGCMAYLTVGLGQLVVGSVLEPMVHAYGVHYGDGGQLVMNQFLGGLAGTIAAPFLIGRIGRKGLLLAAFLGMAVMEFLYMAQPAWGIMLGIAPLTGFCFGIIESLIGSIIIASTGDRANVAMSRLETFFGAGALIIPFAGAALIEIGQWKLAFGIVGALAAVTFVLWVVLWPTKLLGARGEAVHQAEAATRAEGKSLRLGRRYGILLGICALFFVIYVGMEMSYVHYLPSMLVQENGLSDAAAATSISVFWAAMTLGRLVSGHIADRISGGMYLFWGTAIGALCFLLMALTGGTTEMFIFSFIAGFAFSGLFAIALVFTNRSVPGATERITSLLIAYGLLGGAIMPKLIGWSLDHYAVSVARWIFFAIAAAMIVVVLAAIALSGRKSRAKSPAHSAI